MRLGLFDRIRRLIHPRRSAAITGNGPEGRHRKGQPPASESVAPPEPAGPSAPAAPPGTLTRVAPTPPDGFPASRASLGHGDSRGSTYKVSGPSAVRSGTARARVREAPDEAAAIGVGEESRPMAAAPASPQNWYDAAVAPELAHTAQVGMPDLRDEALARAATGVPRQPGEGGRPPSRVARAALRMGLPFTAPHSRQRPRSRDGRRNCGSLEDVLWRQWDATAPPPPAVVAAIDRLAELPERIKERLVGGLDAIFVGAGGVPELDEMTSLRGVPLPSGQASWDACAGAYGERKIVVGSQPSPTPDVMCHEVGHALDDLDSPPGKWQSDSAEFRMLYDQCQPHLASDFHRQPGGLGRKEFFADAFAAIASSQRPALVDMLSGDTRTALRVMLYFNRRYGI